MFRLVTYMKPFLQKIYMLTRDAYNGILNAMDSNPKISFFAYLDSK